MAKRSFIILIVLSIVLSSFLVVGATEASDNGLVPVDLLDYSTFNGSGRNYGYLQESNNFTFQYYAPVNFTYWYVDVIFEADYSGSPITSLSGVYAVGSSGTTTLLTYKHLGNGTWRAYGVLPNRFSSGYAGIKVASSYSRFFVSVDKFDVYTLTSTSIPEIGEIQSYNFTNSNNWQTMSSPGIRIGGNFLHFDSSAGYSNFSVHASSVNWRNYDFIDFKFEANISTLDGITAEISVTDSDEFVKLPFEVSWINGTAIGANTYVNITGTSPTAQLPSKTVTYIELRVFIPSEYRNYGSLFIRFSGKYPTEDAGSSFVLTQCTGYYCVHDYDPQLVKLDQIRLAIEESLSSSDADNSIASDTRTEISNTSQSIKQDQQTLNNVSKPSASELGEIASADSILDTGGMNLLVNTLIPITHSKIVLAILTLSATLALVGYVFFGKKK